MISWLAWTASRTSAPASSAPLCAGELFDLHACVQALFTIKLRPQPLDQDQQAA
jgi:hypothetical protein